VWEDNDEREPAWPGPGASAEEEEGEGEGEEEEEHAAVAPAGLDRPRGGSMRTSPSRKGMIEHPCCGGLINTTARSGIPTRTDVLVSDISPEGNSLLSPGRPVQPRQRTPCCRPRSPGYTVKRTSDVAMTTMPITIEFVTYLSAGSYRNAVGMSSRSTIMIIIPATMPKRTP